MERKYYIGGSEKSAVTLSERQIRRQIEKYGIPKDLYVDNPACRRIKNPTDEQILQAALKTDTWENSERLRGLLYSRILCICHDENLSPYQKKKAIKVLEHLSDTKMYFRVYLELRQELTSLIRMI